MGGQANCAHGTDGSLSHIMNHSTSHRVCNASFSICAYHSTAFTAEWSVRKTSIAWTPCIPLTLNHRRLRPQWCNERRMWVAEWNEAVFTDESRICLQRHDGQIRVWRHRGESMLNSCTTTLVLH
ncbi:transposable element Tcb1 transposase [Trichonephila clavipes]|nr:transposable element Tcb1 transposase [Trichonephila clavipes]